MLAFQEGLCSIHAVDYDDDDNNDTNTNTNNNNNNNNNNKTRKLPLNTLQKTATLRTSFIIGKVLQSEIWSPSGGDHRWCKRRSTREKRL
jgi:hypothetical protein